jgi:hypothetical protein
MKTDTSKTDTSTAGMTDEQKIAKAKKDNPLRSFLLGGFEVRQDPKTGQVANMPMISYVFTRDTAQLREYLNMPVVKKNFPADCRFYFGIADKENREKNKVCILYSIKTNGKDAPKLGGDHITDTQSRL